MDRKSILITVATAAMLFAANAAPAQAIIDDWYQAKLPAPPQLKPVTLMPKFINSDPEKTLKDKGIKTVVAMGTPAQTSVLHTGGEAALRGFKVIVPVDAMSSDDLFPELYTAWHLSTAARISNQTTLTKLDMIGF